MISSIFLAGLGVWEIVAIIAVVLLLFGGKKIPELMRGLGRGIKEFKEGKDGDPAVTKDSERRDV